MKIHIGRSSLGSDLTRYAQHFDLLEVRIEAAAPRGQKLRAWRKSVPADFVFSLVVPRGLAALDAQALASGEVAAARAAAEALGARFFLLQTPASVRPSERTKQRLAELAARLELENTVVAWEPRGIWGEKETERWAQDLGFVLVRDLSRVDPPDSECIYTRLLALGDGARVRPSAVERVADRLSERAEAFVIIEGDGAARAAQMLRELLAGDSSSEAMTP